MALKEYKLPFGRGFQTFMLPEEHVSDVLEGVPTAACDIKEATVEGMRHPIGSAPLAEKVQKGDKVCLIIADITRAWNHARHFAVSVDKGMDEETGVEHVAAFLHIFADRISFGFKDMGIGIQAGADFVAQGVAVVLLDGIPPCYAGKDKFASAAEACHVMGGKSVQENDFVRFRDAFIQPYFRAAGGHAHMGEHVFIPAVMLVHGNASRHFFSHTFDIFRVGVCPVGTLGENDENVFIRNSCEVQFIDYMDSAVSYTHLRAHETDSYLVCRLLLEKKKLSEKRNRTPMIG